MLTWKRYGLVFALGFLSPIALALYAGGERIAVAGFKLSAIENGFALAQRDWMIDGVPAHDEPERVAQVEPAPVTKGKKVAKR